MAFLAAMALAVPRPVRADLYSPDRPLLTIETEFFSIIFPEDSSDTAARLAAFADDAYREVAALLSTEPRGRLPVVITPDHEETNGYFTTFPYSRIALFEAAIDPVGSLGGFDDDLRSLFVHELSHAVSLSLRTPAEDAAVKIFGSPLGLSSYLTPSTFVEGVTVSFESLGGHGRANDPLSAAILRQDLVEGRWKTFAQASSAYDAYPAGSLHYIYGGYFSRYLQREYGMPRYAELWREFGAKALFRPLDDGVLGKGRFARVYGLSLSEAWDDFKADTSPKSPIYMAVEAIAPPSSVSAMATLGSRLAIADHSADAVLALDPATGESRRLFGLGAYATRLDSSGDGSRLLVSAVADRGGFSKLTVLEWIAGRAQPKELGLRGLRDAAYLGEPARSEGPALAAVAVDGFRTDLVAVKGERASVLLSGSDRVSFSSPAASPDGSTLYALARVDGDVRVIRMAIVAEADGYRAEALERLDIDPELPWIRYLSYDGETLRFGWDDGSFYRLAELQGEILRYQTLPTSGGVHRPVALSPIDGQPRVYYLGRFSAGISPCAFPLDREPLGFSEAGVSWLPWDGSAEDGDGEAPRSGGGAPIAQAASRAVGSRARAVPTPYRALRWALPSFWYPTAAADLDGLESAGIVAYSADPAERFKASIAAAWDFRAGAVDAAFEAALTAGRAALNLGISDEFLGTADGSATRVSTAKAGLGWAASFLGGASAAFGSSAAIQAYASMYPDDLRYAPWSDAFAALEAQASLRRLSSRHNDPEAVRGYSTSLALRLDAPVAPEPGLPTAGLEASLGGGLWAAAASFSASGALSLSDGLSYGPRGRVYASGATLSASYPAYGEFDGGTSGPWHVEAEAGVRLLGAELQKGFGPLYANRLSIRAGLRAYATGGSVGPWSVGDAGWSAWARASLTWTPAIGTYAQLHPVASIHAWYRPDREADAYGFGLTLSTPLD